MSIKTNVSIGLSYGTRFNYISFLVCAITSYIVHFRTRYSYIGKDMPLAMVLLY